MSGITISLPTVAEIQSLGIFFFVFFLIGMGIAYGLTKKVYISIGAGIGLGAIALIISTQYMQYITPYL